MTDELPPSIYRRPIFRIGLLLLLISSIWAFGLATGLHENLSAESIRIAVEQAGVAGVLVFIALFTVGQIAHISGHPFIAAAVFAWGWWEGAFVSVVAATVGACLSFFLARTIGGDVRSIEKPWLQKLLASLDDAPMRTIFAARAIFMTAPPLATGLALSGVRHRDHAVATFLGLIPPVFVTSYGWLHGLQWLGVS